MHLSFREVSFTEDLPGIAEIHLDCVHTTTDATRERRHIVVPRNTSVDCPDCSTQYTWQPRADAPE